MRPSRDLEGPPVVNPIVGIDATDKLILDREPVVTHPGKCTGVDRHARVLHVRGRFHVLPTEKRPGQVYLRQRRYEAARPLLERSVRLYQAWAAELYGGLSEAEGLNLARRLPGARDDLLSAAGLLPAQGPGAAEAVYAHVWRGNRSGGHLEIPLASAPSQLMGQR